MGKSFPTNYYVETIARFLDTIKYEDTNYTHKERIDRLHYAYSKTAEHFAQPQQQAFLTASPQRLQASLQTIVAMVVYSWTKITPELCAELSIHYTYTLILDDTINDPNSEMQTFYDDLLSGKQQKNGWWKLVNEHFPKLLKHYGPFCGLNLVRSTIDFFEGCWIEQYNFRGFLGSHDYPLFLRRLNGLGHCVGASLFPSSQFNEQDLFVEITSVVAQMENWMVFVNDLMSFYKEFDDPRDQTSLVNNYCQCEGISINEALDKLVYDVIHSSEQISAVFEEKDGQIRDTLVSFIQGYTTWHLVDPRYRLKEVYKEVGNSPAEEKFSKYCEMAKKVGAVDPAEWAYPSVAALVERKANQPGKVTVLQKMRSWKPAFVLPALPVIFLVLFSFSFVV